ncbi:MAG: zinc ABC transporter substrate-binding protein [Agathobacter sp.]|nr:zinc ABC transporter substrate-binding protein [Agathobacter sp.]
MKNKYVFVVVMLVCILVASMGLTTIYVNSTKTVTAEKKADDIKIVTSFYPMYIATANIVKDIDGVTIENLSEPQTGCLHDFQMTPADMKLLSTADVFVVNGGGIEGFMSEVASAYPDLKIVEACGNVSLLGSEEIETDVHEQEAEHEIDSHDHEAEEAHDHETEVHDHETEVHDSEAEEAHDHETAVHDHEAEEEHVNESHDTDDEHEGHNHDHGEGNAHAWMSVAAYRNQVSTIASELARINPKNSEKYNDNAKKYDDKLARLQEKQDELKALASGKNIIIFHEAYEYVASDYGMNVCYTMDLDEERQVSAGEVAEVIDEINENNVSLILAEELYGKNMGDTVLKEADVKVVYIDALNRGDYSLDSYIDGMTSNIDKIKSVLNEINE